MILFITGAVIVTGANAWLLRYQFRAMHSSYLRGLDEGWDRGYNAGICETVDQITKFNKAMEESRDIHRTARPCRTRTMLLGRD